jgi:hypothetical protein
MSQRHNLNVLDRVDEAGPADEQLVADFRGRLDDHVGRFLGRPQADRWVGDRQLGAILGYPIGGGGCSTGEVAWSLQTLLQQVLDAERELAADAFQAALEHGHPVVLSCRLRPVDDTVRTVVITADMMEAEPIGLSMADLVDTDELAAAAGPWMAGQLIDLTAARTRAARAAADHAVTTARRDQAVIEQAKGILMMAHRIDAEAAFRLLSRHSQDTNTKLQDLAARLVDQTSQRKRGAAPDVLDILLSQSPDPSAAPPCRRA